VDSVPQGRHLLDNKCYLIVSLRLARHVQALSMGVCTLICLIDLLVTRWLPIETPLLSAWTVELPYIEMWTEERMRLAGGTDTAVARSHDCWSYDVESSHLHTSA
jgi:hypothetical protein